MSNHTTTTNNRRTADQIAADRDALVDRMKANPSAWVGGVDYDDYTAEKLGARKSDLEALAAEGRIIKRIQTTYARGNAQSVANMRVRTATYRVPSIVADGNA